MYKEIKEKFAELESQLSDPKTLSDRDLVIKLSQEHSALKKILDLISKLEETTKRIAETKELVSIEEDESMHALAQEELSELEELEIKLKAELEEELNPKSPNDKKNAIFEIRAGTGGDEAAIFAGDLFRMYSHYCEGRGWKIELISSSPIGVGGYKEIVFGVKGEGSYGLLKLEAGTHRVQRVPETEKQGRVHTSTATVVVLPEADDIDIEIKANDIRIDTFCSSGPGGQSVNTTYSAIRITHLETGITVSCQDQKSQHQNKEKALKVLRSRLFARQEEERLEKESSERKDQVGSGDRSDKVRTYNFSQDRVTDHRINKSWHNINLIMEGDIEDIIHSLKEASNNTPSENEA